MFTTNQNVAQNATNITTLNSTVDKLTSGGAGLVQQGAVGDNLTVGANTDGKAVDFTGTAGARTLTGVADGALSAASSDAVNGSQLFATNENVAQNAANITALDGRVTSNETSITALDGRVTTNETNITALDGRVTTNETKITAINDALDELSSGSAGLVQQAGAGANLTVGANTDGAAVDFTGTAGARTLTGVAEGTLSATSNDAVNGSQLFATNQAVAQNAANITALDGRVTTNETNITAINDALDELSSGSAGLVQQAGAGANLTVGANTDGAAVDFTGTAGARTLTGVADGTLSATSNDAVNGSQLFATNENVVQNTRDIAQNVADITQIRSDLSSGSLGIVQQQASSGAITVGAASGGQSVDFSGADGARRLTGVANGVGDDDAVTVSQMKATLAVDLDNRMLTALQYDDISLGTATLGGMNGTVIANLADGRIAAGSKEAVNGGQLYALQEQFGQLADRVTNLEENGSGSGNTPEGPVPSPGTGPGSTQVGSDSNASGSNGTAVGNSSNASGPNSSAIGQGSNATGDNSTALGQNAKASGSNSTAIGQGSNASGANSTTLGQGSNASGSGSTALGQNANASGNNAVALGQGSIADRDNSVSVGSAGNERQITNVAAGTAPTDAVNVQQMNNRVDSARRDAFGGVAAALAVAGLPQSTQPGRTFVALGGSTYGGEYGSALGLSYMTRDGKWTVKASASTSSRGEVGVTVGGGFYW
ncbi:autotransporter adhesin [Burkholderia ambifaria]|nr:autotransporter adhesin [Burkholderia ambifaria]